MPAKKTSTRSGAAAMSKAAFIHSLLPSVPVNEVVARAKAEGLNVTQGYVRWVRWQSRSATKATAPATKPRAPTAKPTTRRTTPRKAAPVPRPITNGSSAETLLKALGAELGLGKAMEILVVERAKVRAVIGR